MARVSRAAADSRGRHAHVGEALDVGGQVGVGLDAVAAGDPGHLETAPARPARLGQLLAHRLHLVDGQLEKLGQQARGDRFDGHHQNGFDGPGLGREHGGHPSYSSTSPAPTPTGSWAAATQATSREPNV